MTTEAAAQSERASGATLLLLTLATGQFLMTLDSSVMNVSIATLTSAFITNIQESAIPSRVKSQA